MENLFSIDGKFYHFMCKVSDCMILSVLWLVCSLPVITMGAASSALYYAVLAAVRKGEGSAARYFFRGLRENWKQASLVALVGFAFSAAISVLRAVTGENAAIILTVLSILFLAWLHYAISYIARFHAPIRKVIVNTLVICLTNLPASLSMAALFVATTLAFAWVFPASGILLLILPAVYALVNSFLLEKVYRKYLPESEEAMD